MKWTDNLPYSELMDRLFQQHMDLDPGEPISVTPEEFQQVQRMAMDHELTLTSTLSEMARRLKDFSKELGIPLKPYFCGREIRVCDQPSKSKEEIRAELSREIAQCPECRAYKRVAFLNASAGLPILEECRKHWEALERLDKPTPTVQPPRSLQWRTIDTAPRDGTPILGFERRDSQTFERFVCLWVGQSPTDGRWVLLGCLEQTMRPTDWMPLPEGPKKS